MKVLLVNGSPHAKGSTYTALCEVAETLNQEGIETELFWIGNKPIGGCIGCRKCGEIGNCVFDDVVNQFRKRAMSADGFIFGSPVHGSCPKRRDFPSRKGNAGIHQFCSVNRGKEEQDEAENETENSCRCGYDAATHSADGI